MTSKIYLKGVKAYGYVGYLPEENVLGQWFEVDATLWVDFEKATNNDDIEDTVNYISCIRKIENLTQTHKFKLIERLAGAIADSLLEDTKITQVEVKIIKHPPIPNFLGSVAVEIVRSRDQISSTNTAATQLKATTESPSKASPKTKVTSDSPISNSQSPITDSAPSKIISIHTDGACSKNPGPGGWGVVIHFDDGSTKEIGGGIRETTNNQMELQGAIAALEFLATHKQSTPVDLYTDSKYVLDGITKWIKGWKKNGWKTKDNKPVKNQELWQQLDPLNSSNIRWHWVEGHSGDPDNERCDAIARSYTAKYA
ncbi:MULTISPECIES: ribonuclease HI [Pseudanabaena]|uniref:Ribonuclease H n=2 Tax=Pseudanabaena TaxID=1152 RepID=L8MVI2_9CYAN|nr:MULTISPECIES: ribonuclease HI [Pseudanabaena]ELS31967.1 Ribonuclease H [Pseudanabaena biceps PCC 7429]MDG3495795.1 ribonuclease HI [Pseudanabaena catenata USMAC16]